MNNIIVNYSVALFVCSNLFFKMFIICERVTKRMYIRSNIGRKILEFYGAGTKFINILRHAKFRSNPIFGSYRYAKYICIPILIHDNTTAPN